MMRIGGFMARRGQLFINLVLVVIILVLLTGTFAAGTNPGSSSDPIVTQSYVENRIQLLNDAIDERLTELENRPVSSGGTQEFVVLNIKTNQVVNLGANSMFILRSGEATAIAGQGGGLSDLTTGLDLATGQSIERNHLLLIPKSDGRGITMTYEGWVMISGEYSID
jgi:hypothetical protein